MRADPRSFLQRSICYDLAGHFTLVVSLGYVVQVFPNIVLPRDLDRSEKTYTAWNRLSHRNEFDFDTRDPHRSICKKPVLFFFKDVKRHGNATLGSYARATGKDYLKRKVLCFPRSPPLNHVKNIQVLGFPLRKNWHLVRFSLLFLLLVLWSYSVFSNSFDVLGQVPRRLCCKINQSSDAILKLTVGQCRKGALSSVTDSVWMLDGMMGREL